jgi:hypothetical protein
MECEIHKPNNLTMYAYFHNPNLIVWPMLGSHKKAFPWKEKCGPSGAKMYASWVSMGINNWQWMWRGKLWPRSFGKSLQCESYGEVHPQT